MICVHGHVLDLCLNQNLTYALDLSQKTRNKDLNFLAKRGSEMLGGGEREAVRERRGFVGRQRTAHGLRRGLWCHTGRREAKGEGRENYGGEGEVEGVDGANC